MSVRRLLATGFILLLSLASVERRLSEWDLGWQPDCLWENDEAVDGEEVLSRLIFVDDTALPRPPALAVGPVVAALLVTTRVDRLLFQRYDPRAPPRS